MSPVYIGALSAPARAASGASRMPLPARGYRQGHQSDDGIGAEIKGSTVIKCRGQKAAVINMTDSAWGGTQRLVARVSRLGLSTVSAL